MSAQQQNVPGTFIRGADGALYFVPDSELESYRVPESGRPVMEEFLNANKHPEDRERAHPLSLEATHHHVPGHIVIQGGTRGIGAGQRAAVPPQEGSEPEK